MPVERLARVLKIAGIQALYYSGAMGHRQRRVLRNKALVLMYHRVLSERERSQTASHPAIVVSVKTFERQMALLKERFNVLTLAQFADHVIRRVPFPDSSVLITFDDGWRDNCTNALPILRRYGLPAVVFLPAAFVGSRQLFWQETLVHLVLRAPAVLEAHPERATTALAVLAGSGLAAVLDTPAPRRRAAAISAVGRLKSEAPERRRELIEALSGALELPALGLSDVDAFVDFDQIQTMAGSGIAFGGHGVEHLLLTQVSDEQVCQEVSGSKEFLGKVGAPLPTFSYPNGFINARIADTVRSAGFTLAFTTKRGLVTCDDDPMHVGRLNVHEGVTSSPAMFLARMTGLF